MALILHFRNRADLTDTGGPNHTTLTHVRARQVGGSFTNYGPFRSVATDGDGLPDWSDHTVDVTGVLATNARNEVEFSVDLDTSLSGAPDTSHISNVYLEDDSTGETWNAEYPEGAVYPSHLLPNGITPTQVYELGSSTTGGSGSAKVYNLCTDTIATVDTGKPAWCTWYFSMGLVSAPCTVCDDVAQTDGLTIWLDAYQEAHHNGDDIATWTDRSGNGNDASQGTASRQPSYSTGIQNGLQGITFDGTEWLTLPSTGLFDIGAGTTFVVGQSRGLVSGETTGYMLASTDISGGSLNRYRWYFFRTTTSVGVAIGPNTYTQNAEWGRTTSSVDAFTITWLRSDGTTGSTKVACSSSYEAAFPSGPYSGAATNRAPHIGAFTEGTQSWLIGEVCEIVHYNRTLTDAEVGDVRLCLQNKWGIVCPTDLGGLHVGKMVVSGGIA